MSLRDGVAVLFILSVFLIPRIWVASYTLYLSGIDGYYHLRISEHILKNGFIPWRDNMVAGGRPHIYPPGFHIFLVSMRLVLNLPLEEILRNTSHIFGFLSVLLIYTRTRRLSLIISVISCILLSLSPGFLWRTTVNGLTSTMSMFLFTSLITLPVRVSLPLIILSFLTSGESLIFVPAVFIILSRRYGYIRSLIILLSLSSLSLIYYLPRVNYELHLLNQFVPSHLARDLFHRFTVAELFLRVNPALVVLSIPGIVAESVLFLTSALLLYLHHNLYIEMDRSFTYLSILFSLGFPGGVRILRRSRAGHLVLAAVCVMVFTDARWNPVTQCHMFCPLVNWGFMMDGERMAYDYLSQLPEGSVLSSEIEGHWITSLAGKRVYIDGNFLAMPDAEERYNLTMEIYTTRDDARFRKLLKETGARYLVSTYWPAIKFNGSYIYMHPCLRKIYTKKIERRWYAFGPFSVKIIPWSYYFDIYETDRCLSSQ